MVAVLQPVALRPLTDENSDKRSAGTVSGSTFESRREQEAEILVRGRARSDGHRVWAHGRRRQLAYRRILRANASDNSVRLADREEPHQQLQARSRPLLGSPDYAEVLAGACANPPAVVFLGDSCTQWGTYPALAIERLKESRPALANGVKLGVAGWSSVQGLTQLRRDVLSLNPRIVTVYFGWNDHWRSNGPADADARLTAAGWWLSQHLRVYELWMKVRLIAAPMKLRNGRFAFLWTCMRQISVRSHGWSTTEEARPY